jgi:ABC1 family protein
LQLAVRADSLYDSGGGGIRTHGALARPTVFKTAPFDRSGTPPSLYLSGFAVSSDAVEELLAELRRLAERALAEELEVHLRGELNLSEEAHNAELIAGLAASDDTIVVPAVVRPNVSERVLVLERIEGTKITRDHGLPAERASLLAERFFTFYVRQPSRRIAPTTSPTRSSGCP